MAILLLLYVWIPVSDLLGTHNNICRGGNCTNLLLTLRVSIKAITILIEKTIIGGGGVFSLVEVQEYICSYSQLTTSLFILISQGSHLRLYTSV